MSILRQCFCLFIISVSSFSVKGQIVPVALDAKLRHTLDSMRNELGAKSLSAAIQFADGAVWAHADGVSSVLPPVDVTPDDVYLIGSVAKTITSACIMQMADDGLLSLDDSLHEWLNTMPYIDPNITIRQLLQHTSGLYDVLSNPQHQDSLMADMSRIWTPEELIERFMAPPIFQPGTAWSYCNTNYFLLGMIIKSVTGNPFYTEIRNRFYSPLGLNTFAIPAFEPLNSPVAHVWLDINGDNILDDAHNFYMNYMALNSTAGAAGGYFATPTECTKWMRTYMRGDLLSPAMMSQARTTVTAMGSQGGLYGLGMMRNQTDFLGYEAYGHGGDLVYHASSWYFPSQDASITVFTNDNNKNSWTLIPVIRELLRTYVANQATTISSHSTIAASVSAYPTPFSDQLSVSLQPGDHSGDLEIALKDVSGKIIASQIKTQVPRVATSVHFDGLDTLPGGIYFVTVHAINSLWSTNIKIVK